MSHDHKPSPDAVRPETEKPGAPAREASPTEPTVISSADLLGETREISIEHQGSTYRLVVSRDGKQARPAAAGEAKDDPQPPS